MTLPRTCTARSGFTLVEILVATTLTLMMMAAVVQIFGLVGESVSDSRATLEMNDRLRAATNRLQLDLAGVTAPTLPPLRMSEDPGYFEYVEGRLGVATNVSSVAVDANGAVDRTVTDFDDILMFTTRSADQPFVGRWTDPVSGTQTAVESRVAEVAWFVRGGNLYRRVLLVLPGLPVVSGTNFYRNNDISVRNESGALKANSLGDLTRRECRYGHPIASFPFDVQAWGWYGLPTLGDTSGAWTVGQGPAGAVPSWAPPTSTYDFWRAPQPTDTLTNPRALEDVILSNVIGFDVKAWDPLAPVYNASGARIGLGAYVDLGLPNSVLSPTFHYYAVDPRAGLGRTYDTWSDYYAAVDNAAVNGFDDPNSLTGVPDGVVDDIGEATVAPPYAAPLRGIQVKIRVFEPDSRQIREVTVVQDFMPK